MEISPRAWRFGTYAAHCFTLLFIISCAAQCFALILDNAALLTANTIH